jgi:phospholipid transport system substrate-binding protein
MKTTPTTKTSPITTATLTMTATLGSTATTATKATTTSSSSLARWTIACCLSLVALGLTAAAQAQSPAAAPANANTNTMGPQEIVENSAKRMLAELDKNREMYAKDPAKLDALVANVLLPNFDSEYAARLVLGQTWRTATEEQRKRFVDAFYHSLLRNYGTALLNFTADKFVILPYKGDPTATTATVRTEVKRSNGETVPVNFSLHKTDAGWKAWDVVIEGISYVKSFRTDFASEIQQKGLDEVINRLEADGKVRANGGAPGTHN